MSFWKITAESTSINASIQLPSSKSISNRALILQKIIAKLRFEPTELINISQADDTKIMQSALALEKGTINIKNAGTCLRFLTAYYAATPLSDITINCDERMKERPIASLVNQLNLLGADITYLEKQGFAPIHISGKKLVGGKITIDASQTSQFTSALIMVAPLMENTLEISFSSDITSFDYIELTIGLMQEFGFQITVMQNPTFTIHIQNSFFGLNPKLYHIEADWSSASFFYEAALLSKSAKIYIPGLSLNSRQGDQKIAEIMESFGVFTSNFQEGLLIEKKQSILSNTINEINLKNYPDLAPALITAVASLGIPAVFSGLSSLKVKESNRFEKLLKVLQQLGYNIKSLNDNSLQTYHNLKNSYVKHSIIQTENDHRLAMCFSLLALINPNICLNEIESVEKSFPQFWSEIAKIGIKPEIKE